MARFPASVFGHGTEPDPRFTLANERTFLAWIRTALALVAGGVALELLGDGMHPGLRLAAALTLVIVGLIVAWASWFAWAGTERALRLSSPLPASVMSPVVAVAVVVAGALVFLAMVVG